MVNVLKKLTLLAVGSMVLSVSAEATAVFARQYDMKCSACHIGLPPALNSTGQKFYRDGFKFDKSEKTTIEGASDGDFVPLSVMLGVRYKNGEGTRNFTPKPSKPDSMTKKVDETDPTFKIMSSGSINSNLAYFVGAKFAYMDVNDERSFEMEGRKAYLMYGSDDSKHVARAGSISPYAQLGNIKRSVEGSGISSDLHITPLVRAGVNNRIFGMDYSYKSESGLGFLASVGTITEDVNQLISDERMNYVLGLDYYNDSDLRASFIMSHTASQDTKAYSSDLDNTVFMIPVEYSMNDEIFFNVSAVYEAENSKAGTDEYIGVEAAFQYAFMENAQVRCIVSTDNDDSKTYALKYAQMFSDTVMVGANLSMTDSQSPTPAATPFTSVAADATAFGASISYVY